MNDFYRQDTVSLSKKLLGKTLTVFSPKGPLAGVIAETEAYAQGDPACHGFGGKKTKRNQSMFLSGGHIYIYFIYGMYHCLNIVSEEEGTASAVLIRSIIPILGTDQMQQNRGSSIPPKQLSNGPAKLVIAMDIQPSWDGQSLLSPHSPITISGASAKNCNISCHPRIGISKGKELLWRFVYHN